MSKPSLPLLHRWLAASLVAALVVGSGIRGSYAQTATAPTDTELASAGLTQLPVKATGDTFELPIKIVSEPRCFFADRDAIGLELVRSSSPKTRLLLSVEPLQGSESPRAPVVQDILAEGGKLAQGIDFTLQIPRAPLTDILGIFICKDSKRAGRCNETAIMPIQSILDQYNSSAKPIPETFVASDKTYFFKPLFLVKGSAYIPTQAMSGARYRGLEQFLLARFKLKETTRTASEFISSTGNALQSIPLRNVKNTVVITLPGFTPGRCRAPEQ